jgi:hypothetical protein
MQCDVKCMIADIRDRRNICYGKFFFFLDGGTRIFAFRNNNSCLINHSNKVHKIFDFKRISVPENFYR